MDPNSAWRLKNKLKDLAKIERGILKAVRRAQGTAGLLIPKTYMPVAYPKPEPITAEILARETWHSPGVVRQIPVTTLCRAIALNEAYRLLRLEGFRHCVVLDLYEGPPRAINCTSVDGGRVHADI